MQGEFKRLHLVCFNEEMHHNSCKYWYAIRSYGSAPHTAFRTREALEFWLAKRELRLARPIPAATGTHAVIDIIGTYRLKSHTNPGDVIYEMIQRDPFLHLSNGRYTSALKGRDSAGIVTIHYLNPNVTRPEYEYSIASKWVDEGKDGLPDATLSR